MPTLLHASISSVPGGAETFLPSTVMLTSAGASAMNLLLRRCQIGRTALYPFYLSRMPLGVQCHDQQDLISVESSHRVRYGESPQIVSVLFHERYRPFPPR